MHFPQPNLQEIKKKEKRKLNRKGGQGASRQERVGLVPLGYSPSTSRSFRASTPGDRMKNTGVAGLLSSHALPRSNLLLSTYFAPSFSSTKFLFKERTCKNKTKQQQPFPRKQNKNWMTEFELEKCQCLDRLGTRKKPAMFIVRGVFRRNPHRFMQAMYCVLPPDLRH